MFCSFPACSLCSRSKPHWTATLRLFLFLVFFFFPAMGAVTSVYAFVATASAVTLLPLKISQSGPSKQNFPFCRKAPGNKLGGGQPAKRKSDRRSDSLNNFRPHSRRAFDDGMPCLSRWEGHALPVSGTAGYSFCILGFCLGEMANIGSVYQSSGEI